MSKVKARTLEALLGVTLGGGVGAAAGGLAYKPDFPLEWTDAEGRVQARRLDPEERAARRSLMAQAALLGAGVGSAATLGGSLARRAVLAKAEREAAGEVGDAYLNSLRRHISKAQDKYHGLEATPGGQGTAIGKGVRREIDAATRLLRSQEAKVNDLLDAAASKRSEKFFGGRTWSMRAGEKVPFYRGSHPDLVEKHFNQLAKSHGFDGFTPANRRKVWATVVDKATSKTAAEAFRRELHVLLEAA